MWSGSSSHNLQIPLDRCGDQATVRAFSRSHSTSPGWQMRHVLHDRRQAPTPAALPTMYCLFLSHSPAAAQSLHLAWVSAHAVGWAKAVPFLRCPNGSTWIYSSSRSRSRTRGVQGLGAVQGRELPALERGPFPPWGAESHPFGGAVFDALRHGAPRVQAIGVLLQDCR